MTTLCGSYKRTFAEADYALLDGVSMNAPYPFFWLKIDRVENGTVRCSAGGETHVLKIARSAHGERATIAMRDPVFGTVRYAVVPLLSDGGTPVGDARPQLGFAV